MTLYPLAAKAFSSSSSSFQDALKESYDNLVVSLSAISDDDSSKKVALMKLNRPKALNALSDAVLDAVSYTHLTLPTICSV